LRACDPGGGVPIPSCRARLRLINHIGHGPDCLFDTGIELNLPDEPRVSDVIEAHDEEEVHHVLAVKVIPPGEDGLWEVHGLEGVELPLGELIGRIIEQLRREDGTARLPDIAPPTYDPRLN
jgi:hypothetical protein